jgi:hypothetical protein
MTGAILIASGRVPMTTSIFLIETPNSSQAEWTLDQEFNKIPVIAKGYPLPRHLKNLFDALFAV